MIKALLLFLTSCTGASYLAQAVAGQAELLDHRRPLESIVKDERAPRFVRQLLAEVPRLKAFATEHGLQPTHNYERYVDLKRPAAVWVVSASQRFSFTPVTWWFPIVGSVPYLGWFRLDDARRFAQTLKDQRLDVSLRPAAAYSTLGFFDDPILSSMLSDEPDAIGDLANTLFHESLHATIYIAGRTDLSEGLASFVGDRMARDYLDRHHPYAALVAYDEGMQRGKARLARLRRLREALEALYKKGGPNLAPQARTTKSEATDVVPLTARSIAAEKTRLIDEAKVELGWKRNLNNATLAEIGRYQSNEDEFQKLFDGVGRDWPSFLRAARARYGSK